MAGFQHGLPIMSHDAHEDDNEDRFHEDRNGPGAVGGFAPLAGRWVSIY